MKGTPERARINAEARKQLEAIGDGLEVKWAEFQSALDAYRDAAYWAGYKAAKSEILESFIKGEK